MTEQRWVRAGFSILLAVGTVSGITLMQQQRLQQQRLNAITPQQQEQQEALHVKSLKYLPSQGFGFNNLIADWTFLRFVQYFGDEKARQATGFNLAPQFFDVITKRDPRFIETYIFSAGTLSYELGQPEASIQLLDRGIAALDPQKHPGAHTLWTLRAFDQLLLLGDAQAASESYRMGGEWAAQSSDPVMRQDAPILQRYSEFLKKDPDSTIVRFGSWNTVYAQAQATGNAKTQSRARNELLLLGAVEAKDSEGQTIFSLPAPKPKPKPTPSPASADPKVTPPAAKQTDGQPAAVPVPSSAPKSSPDVKPAVDPATNTAPRSKPTPTVQTTESSSSDAQPSIQSTPTLNNATPATPNS
ncbi:hypothetical protein [Romeriopsis navalis]|uniref:hypothetical protein n=1 Tax=Romeriopsis navalis TaxID=2992132 RepID=UPI0021F85182|nr:hypothetical protein [Romeriopsis navalis]